MSAHPQSASSMPTPASGNPIGVASLVAASLVVLAQVLASAIAPAMPLVANRFALGAAEITLLLTMPTLVLAIVSVALGVIGLTRRGRGRTAALVGTAVGIAALVPILLGGVLSALVAASL